MLQVADTLTTANADPIFWPVGDDTANTGTYTDENVDSSTEANPAFEQVKWGSYDFHSKMVKVPFTLLRDTAINLESVLGQMLGERLGRILSTECTTGAAKVRGIITRAAEGQESAGATAITREDLVGLQHSIDPAIRSGCSFMFHDVVLEAVRLIEDLQGLPIYQNNTRTGGIDTIEGWPFAINQQMASSITNNAKCVLGGRMNQYKIRRVGSVRLKRLEERYAEYDQIAFIAFMSADGNLLRPSQDPACPVKYLRQHS
jgi:HK97 family phage major capsid protein